MLQRHRNILTVTLVSIAASLGGMGVAVVASGQTNDQASDYTVPLGDYTTTTPGTVPTTPTVPAVTSQGTPSEDDVAPTTTSGGAPTGSSGTPSTATRRGPSHLAFTGAEPLLIGGAGVAFMLFGFTLNRRRRAGGAAA
jgi:hypothetical protein